MALLDIIDVPHPTLKKVAEAVRPEEINDELRTFIKDMIETMLNAPGVGLAAPQVNVSKRILIADASSEGGPGPVALINPVIVETSGDCVFEEGCLSIPEFRAEIKRSKKIVVEFLDQNGKSQRVEDDGFFAIIVQHELDHLNGITMLDHVSATKREMYLKKLKKQRRKESLMMEAS